MSEPEIEEFEHFVPIPTIFQSLHDGPFDKCMICERSLLEDGEMYVIERAFVKEEPIFEYAMCFDCQQTMCDDLSKESMQRVSAHFEEHTDLEARRERMLHDHGMQVEAWIDRCILTGKRRSDCRSYAIYGHCDGGDLLFAYMPYMVSDDGFERLQPLLSKKTRDRLGEFSDEFLGMPPELTDLPLSFI